MADYGPGGGGVNKNQNAPTCTKEYWPAAGGYEGGAIESEGELGEKEAMPGSDMSIAGNKEDGNYENQISWPPNIPHGAPDPEIGGPPLADTNLADPNKSMY